MSFNPTHEFRGLELEFLDKRGTPQLRFRDADARIYHLPSDVVTKIQPKPKPGEVWKYVGEDQRSHLVLITEDAKAAFVTGKGKRVTLDVDDLTKPNFVKVLNADGSLG